MDLRQLFGISRERNETSRTVRILGTASFAFWAASGVIALSEHWSQRPGRAVAQSTDLQVAPSARRGYCGMPASEGTCPFRDESATRLTLQRPLLDEIEGRIRIIISLQRAPEGAPSPQEVAQQAFGLVRRHAERLRNYWARFSAPPAHGEFDPQAFALELSHFPAIEPNAPHRSLALRALNSVLSESIRMADASIRREQDPLLITHAASVWWAARFLQVQFACPDDRPPQEELLRDWVDLQAGLQSCRREYLADALGRLNAPRATGGGHIALDSREWRLIWALGSRRERSQAMIDLLASHSYRNLAPTEVYFIAHQLMQVGHEVRTQQVLTWNGFQPASSEDLELLGRERDALQRAMVETLAQSRELRVSMPTLYRSIRRAWNAVYNSMPRESWTRAGSPADAPALSMAWEQECNEGIHAACLEWLAEHQAIGQTDANTPRILERWNQLILGPPSTETSFLRNSGLQEGIRLQSWLTLLEVYRRQLETGRQSARSRTAWNELHRMIRERIHGAFQQVLHEALPRESVLSQCIGTSEWERWTRADAPILGPDLIQFSPGTTISTCNELRTWIFQLLAMRQMANRGRETLAWQDNPIAVVARYGVWHLMFASRDFRTDHQTAQRIYAFQRRVREFYAAQAPRDAAEVLMQQIAPDSAPWRSTGTREAAEVNSMQTALSLVTRSTPLSSAEVQQLVSDPLY